MRKNQSGVSLIALVITIIVVIILAAVAFSSSTDTITNANFSNFTNNVAEVQSALDTVVTTVKGQEAANGVQRTDAQVYNFVAKGATLLDGEAADKTWLSRGLADAVPCTQVDGTKAKEVLDSELPSMTVNTVLGSKVPVSYFVTKEGTVFVWPPFEHEGNFYVTGKDIVSGDTAGEITEANEASMYEDDFSFTLGETKIVIDKSATSTGMSSASPDTYKDKASVFYLDAAKATSPVGLEATALYDSSTATAPGA